MEEQVAAPIAEATKQDNPVVGQYIVVFKNSHRGTAS
jgi:hypothetical protein